MEQIQRYPVYFNDGCVVQKDYVYIASKLEGLERELELSRMFFYYHGNWSHHDIAGDVCSVCLKESEPRSLCSLTARGEVWFASQKGYEIEKIPEAGLYPGLGPVKQITFIDDHLYVCGDKGQVYRREAGGWVHFDEGIPGRDGSASSPDLNGIHGTREDDLYAVGYNGRILYRSRDGWQELDSPTNYHLERVQCVSPDEVYICGNNGTFFTGNRDGFQDFSAAGLEAHFWGLTYFRKKVYLATLHNGIFVFDGVSLEPLISGLEPEIYSYRLSARDDVLWSFGGKDLAYFDGELWTRVMHPDNV